jgi:hypothetical protein
LTPSVVPVATTAVNSVPSDAKSAKQQQREARRREQLQKVEKRRADGLETKSQRLRRELREAKQRLLTKQRLQRKVEAERAKEEATRLRAAGKRRDAEAADKQNTDAAPKESKSATGAAAADSAGKTQTKTRQKQHKKASSKGADGGGGDDGGVGTEEAEEAEEEGKEDRDPRRAHIVNYESYGVYELRNSGTEIRITELPVGGSKPMSLNNYAAFAAELIKAERITHYFPASIGSKVDLRLTVTPEQLRALQEAPGGIEKQLKLVAPISMRNIRLYASDGTLKLFDSVTEIFQDFARVRERAYEQRKTALLKRRNEELVRASNKARFVLEVILEQELKIKNVPRKVIVATLERMKFAKMNENATPARIARHTTGQDAAEQEHAAGGSSGGDAKDVDEDEDGDASGDRSSGDGDGDDNDAPMEHAWEGKEEKYPRKSGNKGAPEDTAATASDAKRKDTRNYNYLLKMPIATMSLEKVEQLRREEDEKRAEIKTLVATTIQVSISLSLSLSLSLSPSFPTSSAPFESHLARCCITHTHTHTHIVDVLHTCVFFFL